MKKAEALRLLGVYEDDEPEDIRKRYRELIRAAHPDTAGGEERTLERAQRLTLAYRVLKTEGYLEGTKSRREWGIRENKEAFTKRSVFMQEELFGNGMIVDTGIRGKYYWDPDTEPFPLLLKSVSLAAERILEAYTEHCTDEAKLLRIRAKLLHLLLQEFVDPYTAVKEAVYVNRTGKENTYRVSCHIRPESSGIVNERSPDRSGETIAKNETCPQEYPVELSGNNLAVRIGENPAVITFSENALYYIITPMILQGAASGVFRIREKTGPGPGKNRSGSSRSGSSIAGSSITSSSRSGSTKAGGSISGDLILSVDEQKGRDATREINGEIRRMLSKLPKH